MSQITCKSTTNIVIRLILPAFPWRIENENKDFRPYLGCRVKPLCECQIYFKNVQNGLQICKNIHLFCEGFYNLHQKIVDIFFLQLAKIFPTCSTLNTKIHVSILYHSVSQTLLQTCKKKYFRKTRTPLASTGCVHYYFV